LLYFLRRLDLRHLSIQLALTSLVVRILLISSSSEVDLITIPLFFVGEDVVGLTGFISMVMASFQEPIFERGSLSRKMLGTEVKQGTYDYLCILHPWMTGSVIVT
jgi:hypothetical protein